jgi:hypothetical protein
MLSFRPFFFCELPTGDQLLCEPSILVINCTLTFLMVSRRYWRSPSMNFLLMLSCMVNFLMMLNCSVNFLEVVTCAVNFVVALLFCKVSVGDQLL